MERKAAALSVGASTALPKISMNQIQFHLVTYTDASPFWLAIHLCGVKPDGIPLGGPVACLKNISNLFPAGVQSSFGRQITLSTKCLEPNFIVIWLCETRSGTCHVLANNIKVFSVHFMSEKFRNSHRCLSLLICIFVFWIFIFNCRQPAQ